MPLGGLSALDDAALAEHLAVDVGARLVAARQRWVHERRSWWDIEAAADALGHDVLVDALAAARPDDAVLSEEGHDRGDRHHNARCWIVDPLDGSADFPDASSTAFAVHVALVENGEVGAAAVSLPAIGEFHSTRSPRRTVSPRVQPIVIGGRSMRSFTRRLASALDGHAVVVGSSGVKAMAVVRGDADVYVHPTELWEWDVCAPAAVARAAGLHVSGVDGSELRFNQQRAVSPGLVVCRRELRDRVLTLLS
jgi:3'(2'), 5'-bisphosphate nucleotidase